MKKIPVGLAAILVISLVFSMSLMVVTGTAEGGDNCSLCHNLSEIPDQTSGGFNYTHEFHSNLTSCADCHDGVHSASYEVLDSYQGPQKSDCADCHYAHDVQNEEHCLTCHNLGEIPEETSSGIIYTHEYHSNFAISCVDCHSVEKEEEEHDFVVQGPDKHENCADCHNLQDSNQCSTCHSNF